MLRQQILPVVLYHQQRMPYILLQLIHLVVLHHLQQQILSVVIQQIILLVLLYRQHRVPLVILHQSMLPTRQERLQINLTSSKSRKLSRPSAKYLVLPVVSSVAAATLDPHRLFFHSSTISAILIAASAARQLLDIST